MNPAFDDVYPFNQYEVIKSGHETTEINGVNGPVPPLTSHTEYENLSASLSQSASSQRFQADRPVVSKIRSSPANPLYMSVVKHERWRGN